MKISEMIDRKKELGYTLKQIAELSGVPLGTVQKIFSGQTKSPRYDTLRALETALKPEGSGTAEVGEPPFRYGVDGTSATKGEIEPPPFRGKKQGEYTVGDYLAIPDERRVELIDGVIYDMTAPSPVHQVVVGFIFSELFNYVMANKGKCVVNAAPTDVHLDMDDRTMVQPDVLVTCRREKVTLVRVEGAPDFVLEVLSPSTRKKDLYIKVKKYENAGVRELWIVDPRDRCIFVYDFEHDDVITPYSFRDSIPVRIFDGDLAIDVRELSDYLDDLFGDAWWER